MCLLSRMSLVIRRRAGNELQSKAPVRSQSVSLDGKWRERISDYRKDQIVYRQGDPAGAVFYIQSGKVKKTVVSEQGKEAVIALLEAGDFFGEGCLAGESLRLATACALTKCDRANIKGRYHARDPRRASVRRDIYFAPSGAQQPCRGGSGRSAVQFERETSGGNASVLANFGKESRPEPIIAKISQETLAEMIGTTRSRVSHFMNKFRKLGLIDYNGSIEIHSSLLNVVLRDQPQIRN